MIKVWLVTLTDEMCWPAIGNMFKGLSFIYAACWSLCDLVWSAKGVFNCLIVSFEALDCLTKTKMQLSFLHNRLFTQRYIWYKFLNGTLIKLLWTYYTINNDHAWVVRVHQHIWGWPQTRLPDNKVILCYAVPYYIVDNGTGQAGQTTLPNLVLFMLILCVFLFPDKIMVDQL